MVRSARLALTNMASNQQDRVYDIEAIEEIRQNTKDRWSVKRQSIKPITRG